MLRPQLYVGRNAHSLSSERIDPVQNRYGIKPKGGLWTSSYHPQTGSGWVQWCMSEHFKVPEDGSWESCVLTPRSDAKILVVNTYDDLLSIIEKYPDPQGLTLCGYTHTAIDFEKMSLDYDAMHLTEDGQWETRLTHPHSLYGWDCESTVWFRWVFEKVEYVGQARYEEAS